MGITRKLPNGLAVIGSKGLKGNDRIGSERGPSEMIWQAGQFQVNCTPSFGNQLNLYVVAGQGVH